MKVRALHGLALTGLFASARLISRVDTPLPGSYPTSSLSLAAGDLDGDGIPDLVAGHAVVRGGSGKFGGASALLSRGNGTFTTSLLPVSDSAVRRVALADVDGDSRLDLVAAWRSSDGVGDVRVFKGLGNGAFAPGAVVAPDITPGSFATGDLNADGRTDLVVIDRDPRRLLVYIGRGDGTFGDAQVYPNVYATAVAIGDLDRDGAPDVALTLTDSVAVMHNNGKGALAQPVAYPGGKNVRALVMVDLDRDGYRDIVTADAGDNTVSVYRNRHDGTLRPRRSYPVGVAPESLAAGFVNGDKNPDVVTANAGDDTVTVLFGDGNGAFLQRSIQRAVGPNPGQLVLADITGRGRADIVTGNRGNGSITVLPIDSDD